MAAQLPQDTIRYRGRRYKRQSQEKAGSKTKGAHSSTHHPPSQLKCGIVLPPPEPPKLTSRGRPISAKGRIHPRSTASTTVEIKQFPHQKYRPLPSIGFGNPSDKDDCLTETDSAVDLDYASASPSPVPHCVSGENPPQLQRHGGGTTLTQPFGLLLPSKPKVLWHRQSTPQCSDEGVSKSVQCHAVPFPPHPEPAIDDPGTVLLSIKLPSGTRIQRCFRCTDRLSCIVAFARRHSREVSAECELSTSDVPKKVFEDFSLTLAEAGLTTRMLLHMTPL